LSGYIFCLPWLIGLVVFQLYPFIRSFILSVSKVTDLSGLKTKYIGFENYTKIFTEDVNFVPAFLTTIRTIVVYTPFIIVLALVISILLNRKIKGRGVFRVIFFLPVLLGSGIVMAQLGNAANILQIPPSIEGYINYYFSQDIAKFLSDVLSEIVRVFWKTGVQIIIFLGGLQSIPDSYYEAAKVDNANGWDMLWKITLPMLSPMIFLNVIYTIIDNFRDESNPISKLIVAEVFTHTRYEYGSTMGWLYFIIAFSVVGIVSLIFRRFVYYEK
jgi:ABC-type sugar transport system permease subunit